MCVGFLFSASFLGFLGSASSCYFWVLAARLVVSLCLQASSFQGSFFTGLLARLDLQPFKNTPRLSNNMTEDAVHLYMQVRLKPKRCHT